MNPILLYSEKEQFLFYVFGHIKDTNNVQETIDELIKGRDKFARIASVDKKNICHVFITASSEYKNMRIFYIKTNDVPEEATRLRAKAWTMMSFLTLPYQRQ
jgi:hypothetical protein